MESNYVLVRLFYHKIYDVGDRNQKIARSSARKIRLSQFDVGKTRIDDAWTVRLRSCYMDYHIHAVALAWRGLYPAVAGHAAVAGDARSLAGVVCEEIRPARWGRFFSWLKLEKPAGKTVASWEQM